MGKSQVLRVVGIMCLCLTPLPLIAQQSQTSKVRLPSGTWLIAQPMGADTSVFRFTLRFERDSVSGVTPDGLPILGALRGDSVIFNVVGRPDGASVQARGIVRDGGIYGVRTVTPRGASTPSSTGEFFATPQVRPRAPHLHVFTPRVFPLAYSGAVPPVLHISPGDTVRTWTLDNAGRDSTGAMRAPPGNPLTGPFYIDGALRGDIIAVRLHRVRLNRDYAVAGTGIIGRALDPDYFRELKAVPDFSRRWQLDRQQGLAKLDQSTPALARVAIPVRPMLGSVGVAPPGGQVFRATESGIFGGNMDYNQLSEGVTLYLPVFQRGALLYLGDGHALQGDGELTGDALETSMSIEFSVGVIPATSSFGPRLGGPRAENEEFLMAIGISGDLSEALRQATTDLANWIEDDYHLNGAELAAVLGSSVRYDVADLVGSEVSIVAKLPRAVLRQLRSPTTVPGASAPPPPNRPMK